MASVMFLPVNFFLGFDMPQLFGKFVKLKKNINKSTTTTPDNKDALKKGTSFLVSNIFPAIEWFVSKKETRIAIDERANGINCVLLPIRDNASGAT